MESGGNLNGGTPLTTPTITTQPSIQTLNEGKIATFTVVTGSGNPSYQWQQSTDNGSTWKNIDSETYTAAATTTDMSGYQYRCVVTADGVSVISTPATLTVKDEPVTPITYTISADVTPVNAGTVSGSGQLCVGCHRHPHRHPQQRLSLCALGGKRHGGQHQRHLYICSFA